MRSGLDSLTEKLCSLHCIHPFKLLHHIHEKYTLRSNTTTHGLTVVLELTDAVGKVRIAVVKSNQFLPKFNFVDM